MGLGKIFGGTETTTSEQKSSVNVPSWYKTAEKGAFDLMGEISDRPYEAYTGERIAGFTPDQLAAQEGVRGTYQTGQANLGQAMELARLQGERAATGPSQEQLAGMMSPYQQGVTDIGIRKATEEADRQREMLGARAASMDAFGGGRSDLALARIGQGAQETIGDIQTRGSQAAYDRAMGQWNIGQQQLGQAAQTGLGAASGALGTSLQGLSALSGSGAQQQMQEQAMREQEYADYREAKDYDLQRYGLKQQGLQDIDKSLWERTQTTSSTKPTGGWLSKAMGVAGMAMNPMGGAMSAGLGALKGGMSAAGGVGATGPMPGGAGMGGFLGGMMGYKDGGTVKKTYSCGGKVRKFADGGLIDDLNQSWGKRPSSLEDRTSGLYAALSNFGEVIPTEAPKGPEDFPLPEGWAMVPEEETVIPEAPKEEYKPIVSPKLQELQSKVGIAPKETQQAKESKFQSWLEDPMTQWGARMLASDKPFFQALGEASQVPKTDKLKQMQAEKIRRELEDPEYRKYALKKAGRGAETSEAKEAKREDDLRKQASKNMIKELEALRAQDFDFISTPDLEKQLFDKHYGLLKGAQTTSTTGGGLGILSKLQKPTE